MLRRILVMSGVRAVVNLIFQSIISAFFFNLVGWVFKRVIEDRKEKQDVIEAVIIE